MKKLSEQAPREYEQIPQSASKNDFVVQQIKKLAEEHITRAILPAERDDITGSYEDNVFARVAEIHGETYSAGSLITEQENNYANEFLSAVLDEIRRTSFFNESKAAEQGALFVDNVLNHSPNMISFLSLDNLLRLSAISRNIAGIGMNVARVFDAEATYQFSVIRDEKHIASILEKTFIGTTSSRQLDILMYLIRLGHVASASDWSANLLSGLTSATRLLLIHEKGLHPIVRYGAETVLSAIAGMDEAGVIGDSEFERRAIKKTDVKVSKDFIGTVNTYGQIVGLHSLRDPKKDTVFGTASRLFSLPSEERQEEAILLFSHLHNPEVREKFENDFGINIAELTLREQVQLLDMLAQSDTEQVERLKNLLQSYGADAARSFMSVEFGDEFQEYVFQIAETFPETVAHEVFGRYARIVELIQTEASELLEEFFVEGKEQQVDAVKIEAELLRRAKNLIEDFARDAITAKADGEKPDSKGLLKKLEQVNADTVSFTSIFRAAFKGRKDVDFENLRGVEFARLSSREISEEDKREMLAISNANWKKVPSMAKFIEETMRGKLETSSEETEWSILKRNGRILAFGRFDRLADGSLYAGSFNVSSEYRGASIGDALFQHTYDEKAKNCVIYANVYPNMDVASAYVEKYGFVIADVEDVLLPGGGREFGFRIVRDDAVRDAYKRAEPPVNYNLLTDKDRLLADIRKAKSRKEVITRFVIDEKNPDIRWVTFEKQAEERMQKAS